MKSWRDYWGNWVADVFARAVLVAILRSGGLF
jgi:hypothetical protein